MSRFTVLIKNAYILVALAKESINDKTFTQIINYQSNSLMWSNSI